VYGDAAVNLDVMKTSKVLFAGILLAPTVVQFIANSESNRFAASPQGDTSASFESATTRQLSDGFTFEVLATTREAPLPLRFFSTAVKTDSRGRIITGPTNDQVKNIVGPESAGMRAGLARFTKIMFGAAYIDGRPDPGTRIDPNNPRVNSGNQLWPNRPQPFRSHPRALSITPDGRKLYVALPGREGYPDWRVAVVDTVQRRVLR
jgi:hypothetical protein